MAYSSTKEAIDDIFRTRFGPKECDTFYLYRGPLIIELE